MANFMLLLISVLLGSTGQFLFRLGMKSYGEISIRGVLNNFFSIIFKPAIFIGFVLFGLSSVIWLSVISKNQLSYAYPMVSMGYILTLILSYIFLDESINLYRIFGTLLIVSGVILISRTG